MVRKAINSKLIKEMNGLSIPPKKSPNEPQSVISVEIFCDEKYNKNNPLINPMPMNVGIRNH